jgi:hypothetical protein
MKKMLMAVAFLLSTAGLAHAQEVAGDWIGTLKAGDAELRLALHVTKAADGTLSATMDSIDQGANGIPVSAIALASSKLTFSVDAVRGSYEGKVNEAGTAIDGTWTQGQPVPLAFVRGVAKPAAAAKPGPPSDIDGTWMGTLQIQGTSLRLAFHFLNTTEGLSATLDSLDQGSNGMAATSVTRKGASITVEFKQIGGKFAGTIDAALTKIDGTWTQGGGELPLVLTRVKAAATREEQRPRAILE